MNLKEIFDHLGQTVNSLNEVMNKIEKSEGSLGLLINDPALYKELKAASGELNLLLEDMKLNPARYVHFSLFGSRAARRPYSPPTGD